MDRDEAIWSFLLEGRRFFKYNEIKREFLQLYDNQLSKSLRRLEKDGLLVRDIHLQKNRPVNVYLAIDPLDSKFRVRIVDFGGRLSAILEWLNEDDLPVRSFSIDLGELGEYLHSIDGQPYLELPRWISCLAEVGKVTFKEFK